MPEVVVPGPVTEERRIREAVCAHTKKSFDSCRDKDCIEDLRVYLTRSSQEAVDRAVSVKAGCAQLLYAYIDVEPVTFNRGFYTVDVRYYYRISADAFVGTVRPVEVTGLAVFDKRVILFGSEGNAKIFSSQAGCGPDSQRLPNTTAPVAVVEAVDPLILGMKLLDVCDCRPCPCQCQWTDVPPAVAAAFRKKGVEHLIITLGENGSVAAGAEGIHETPCVRMPHVADPTAAGDSFVAAFCTGVCAGLPQGEALAFASHTAAITVTRIGAIPSLPTAAEVQALLRERGYGGFDPAELDALQ